MQCLTLSYPSVLRNPKNSDTRLDVSAGRPYYRINHHPGKDSQALQFYPMAFGNGIADIEQCNV